MVLIKDSLHIGVWNINGYLHKGYVKFDDPRFINLINNKDIICLVETHCSLENCLSLPGYHAVHLIRPKSTKAVKFSGGLSVYVKKELKSGVKFLEHQTNDYIWLKLSKSFFSLQEDIYLCFMYNPPENSSYTKSLDKDYFEILENDIIKYSSLGKILLAGDLNSRTGQSLDFIRDDEIDYLPLSNDYEADATILTRHSQDNVVCSRGSVLNDICTQTGLRILNGRCRGDMLGQFTCHTPRGSSVVDYFIMSQKLLHYVKFFHVNKFYGDLSDHCQISVMLKIRCKGKEIDSDMCLSDLPIKYRWDQFSASKFIETINTTCIKNRLVEIENSSSEDVNEVVHNFNNVIYDVSDITLKKIKTRSGINKGRQKKIRNKVNWFNEPLYKLRRQLDEKAKLFQKFSKDPYVRGAYFSALKFYRKARKNRYREFKQSIIERLDSLYENNPKAYWSLLDKLKNPPSQKDSDEIPEETWFNHFKNLNTDMSTESHNTAIQNDLLELEKIKIFTELDFSIRDKEIIDAVKSLKNNKSSGIDSLLNEMFKCATEPLLKSLSKIFNLVLSTGSFPILWSKSIITPLFKSGEKTDPNNYRGIAVGSCLSKIFTKILNSRLNLFLEKRKLSCPEQIGFCKGKRTTDHMFILKTLVSDKYTQKGSNYFYTCFVDFKKAFDLVWLDGLFYKLRDLGVSDLFYNVIKNMYLQTQLTVRCNDNLTPFFSSDKGVRQGDSLSPTLFKVFVNDLPSALNNEKDSLLFGSLKLKCLLYADDLVLFSTSKDGLQRSLNSLNDYCKKWGLNVNLTKTKCIIFNKGGKLLTSCCSYNGQQIENVRSYTYLGIKFHCSGSFTEAKHNLYCRGLKAYFKLSKAFSVQKPNIKTFFHVFDHTVKPVILYGSEIWGFDKNYNKLYSAAKADDYFYKICKNLVQEKLHIKMCKSFLGVNKRATNLAVMGEVGRYPLMIEIIFNMLKYYHVISTTSDELMSNAYKESSDAHLSGQQSWVGCVKAFIQYLQIDAFFDDKVCKQKSNFKCNIFKKLQIAYFKIWNKLLFSDNRNNQIHGNKLRTYRRFKNQFIQEPYLLWGNQKQIQTLCKFRISAHQLEIERGRYFNVEVKNRICKLCNSDVEDEIHFLLKCPALLKIRIPILNSLQSNYKNFSSLDTESSFIWLMSSEDPFVFNSVYKLLQCLNEERNALLLNAGGCGSG